MQVLDTCAEEGADGGSSGEEIMLLVMVDVAVLQKLSK
jgi:hypothetical protein